LEFFTKFGVSGDDLLDLDEEMYEEMGINEYVHLRKIRDGHDQLLNYQKKFEKEMEDLEIANKANRLYLETKAEYERLQLSNNDSSQTKLDPNIKAWKLVHIFAFFQKPANEELAKIFLKPLINSDISGANFLLLADAHTKVTTVCLSVFW
jgi:hypothetical protein